MKKSIFILLSSLPLIVFSQGLDEPTTDGFGGIFVFVLALAISIIVFLVLRQLFLWYWKIEIILKNQDEQSNHLKNIYNSIEENNRLTQSQIELVIGKHTSKF